MKKTLAALLALSATAAFAAPSAGSFYVGGLVGQSTFHHTVDYSQGGKKLNPQILHNDSGVSYGLHLGYILNNHVSFEFGWQKVAQNRYQVSVNTGTPKNVAATSEDKEDKEKAAKDVKLNDTNVKTATAQHTNIALLNVKFNQFISDSVNVYADLGLGLAINKLDAGFLTYNNVKKVTNKTITPFVAAGIEYYFNNTFSVGAEYGVFIREFRSSGKAASGHYAIEHEGYATATDKYSPNVNVFQGTVSYHFGQQEQEVAAAPVITKVDTALNADFLFKLNSYKLNTDLIANDTQLNKVLALYKSASSATILVVGHTDRLGSKKYNMKLSYNRAQAVANYLVTRGVAKQNIMVQGVGSSEPVTNGCYGIKNIKAVVACLAPDRRVNLTLNAIEKKVIK